MRRTWIRDLVVLGQQRRGAEQDVLEVDPAALAAWPARSRRRSAPPSPGRRRTRCVLAARRAADSPPGLTLLTLAQAISATRSRSRAVSTRTRSRLADSATSDIRLSSTDGQLAAVRLRPEVLRLAQRGGVEGAGLHPAGAELLQPAAHLPGRPGGERDGQHRGRVVGPDGHPVRDPVGDRPGLAGAGARDHRHRAVQRGGHLPLLRVERGQQQLRVAADARLVERRTHCGGHVGHLSYRHRHEVRGTTAPSRARAGRGGVASGSVAPVRTKPQRAYSRSAPGLVSTTCSSTRSAPSHPGLVDDGSDQPLPDPLPAGRPGHEHRHQEHRAGACPDRRSRWRCRPPRPSSVSARNCAEPAIRCCHTSSPNAISRSRWRRRPAAPRSEPAAGSRGRPASPPPRPVGPATRPCSPADSVHGPAS